MFYWCEAVEALGGDTRWAIGGATGIGRRWFGLYLYDVGDPLPNRDGGAVGKGSFGGRAWGGALEWFDLVFLDRLLLDGTCSGLRLWWLLTCSEMRDGDDSLGSCLGGCYGAW